MINTKKIIINGEEIEVPDVKVGDIVGITFDDRYDEDFAEWLDEYARLDSEGVLTVSEVNFESGLFWLEGCPYGLEIRIISEIISK